MVADRRTLPFLQVAALACAPAVGLGITRFAYALLLPDMRRELEWSFAAAGWLNTSNAIGYLLGALLAAPVIGHYGARRTALWGTFACIASLILCALVRDEVALNLARLLGGTGAGFAYVAAALVATRIAASNSQSEALLIVVLYMGPGLGIVLSGLSVPAVLASAGASGWPLGWAILAGLCVPLAIALASGLRDEDHASARSGQSLLLAPMAPMLVGYGLFGAGYIAYMTFMIAFVRDSGGSLVEQAGFWVMLGLAAMVSPLAWSAVMRNSRGGRAFAAIGFAATLGASLPLLSPSRPLLLTSALLFGGSFFAVVASTTSFVRQNLSPVHWTAAIATMTVAFGVGQILGPVLSGYATDLTGSLISGLALSAALLLSGVLFGLFQPDLRQPG